MNKKFTISLDDDQLGMIAQLQQNSPFSVTPSKIVRDACTHGLFVLLDKTIGLGLEKAKDLHGRSGRPPIAATLKVRRSASFKAPAGKKKLSRGSAKSRSPY